MKKVFFFFGNLIYTVINILGLPEEKKKEKKTNYHHHQKW